MGATVTPGFPGMHTRAQTDPVTKSAAAAGDPSQRNDARGAGRAHGALLQARRCRKARTPREAGFVGMACQLDQNL